MGSGSSTPSHGGGGGGGPPRPSQPAKRSVSVKRTEQPVSQGRKNSTAKTGADESACDVMISYSHANKDVMELVKATLEGAGYSVWVDRVGLTAGADFLRKIGQAVIDCKAVCSIMSEKAIASKYCQDELALAYISNKPILPVAVTSPDVLFANMDMGMRLQLARFEWTLMQDERERQKNKQELVDKLKRAIGPPGSDGPPTRSAPPKLVREKSRVTLRKGKVRRDISLPNYDAGAEREVKFWLKDFGSQEYVTWDKFQEAMMQEYASPLAVLCKKPGDREWLMDVLKGELEVGETISRTAYIEFCTIDGEEKPFWTRVEDQATESYCMREVFNVDSSVRVDAIENLSKYHSSAVVDLLLDLLRDKDMNVVTVAAITLARTGSKDSKVTEALIECLEHRDRLVRESGCLALGHLKAFVAVTKLVHLWRNDFISSVRESAAVALEQIGGEEADKAMHVTKVLQDEIRRLSKD